MEKKIFALTYCYEGTYNTSPYGATLAVSTDIEKLKAEMVDMLEIQLKDNRKAVWVDRLLRNVRKEGGMPVRAQQQFYAYLREKNLP